ncbi:MAG: hypothetical protein BWY17_04103 [Deltaproteobacteria bacterium ADurb.Bin207]|jgi:hypothetical protein|nr:MAG: hypothetical protein BWY17_04103 [Deltaproteobacteria bacterium ADurb.Bin207]
MQGFSSEFGWGLQIEAKEPVMIRSWALSFLVPRFAARQRLLPHDRQRRWAGEQGLSHLLMNGYHVASLSEDP